MGLSQEEKPVKESHGLFRAILEGRASTEHNDQTGRHDGLIGVENLKALTQLQNLFRPRTYRPASGQNAQLLFE